MRQRGFSLIELSIVLVILGLLVGGILAGQSLIRASELRGILRQQAAYTTAMHAFKDKYFAMAGDFVNATAFWGRVGGGTTQCANATTNSDTGLPTCNGNGDGSILSHEMFRVWEHLAAAGLIEGSFTGISDPAGGSSMHTPGLNCPASPANGGWTISDRDQALTSAYFIVPYGNALMVGAPSATTTYKSLMTTEEGWNLDTKSDDGKPARGKTIAVRLDQCTDSADETALDSNYRLNSTTARCALIFRQQF